MEAGFPEISPSFLRGQDLMYTQFTDIFFYVEDINQERFYYETLKKLFPNIKFEKIFPLGGKKPVEMEAEAQIGNRSKVFILDQDFDSIFNRLKDYPNIFYLKRYSIENYLLEEDPLKDILIESDHKILTEKVNGFALEPLLHECKELFSDLIKLYLVVQEFDLGIKNVDYDTAYFCNFKTSPASLISTTVDAYKKQLSEALVAKGITDPLEQLADKYEIYFNTIDDAKTNIPGKYLLNFIKCKIESLCTGTKINLSSFSFRLVKNCKLEDLQFLKEDIMRYVT